MKAIVASRRGLALDPGISLAHYNIGTSYLEMERYEEAIASFEAALELKPGMMEALNNLGNAYHHQGRHELAIETFREALAAYDWSQLHHNLAAVFLAAGQADSSLVHFQSAHQMEPGDRETTEGLARALIKAERLQSAQQMLDRALREMPDDEELLRLLAFAQIGMGRDHEALSTFRRAGLSAAEAHLRIGGAARERHVWQRAREHYEAGLETAPEDARLLDGLGTVLVADGDWRSALRLFRRAAEQDPYNRLLWRQNLRRLEAEPLRDSILELAGGLDNRTYGYPVAISARPDGEVVVNDGKLPQRRSIYLLVNRSAPPSIRQLFDQPDIETNCVRRSVSTVPLQALSLLNSDIVSNAAIGFAQRAINESPRDPVGWAYQAAFGRQANHEQLAILTEFIKQQTDLYLATSGERKAWQFGYGTIDSQDPRTVNFTHFPVYLKQQWQLGPDYPHQGSYWAGLNATGGHPGSDKPVIVQWTSPLNGKYRVRGFVDHPSPAGNGIHTTVISSRHGQLAQWHTAHGKKQIEVDSIQLEQGDRLSLVTDMNEELTSDNFKWTVRIDQLDEMGTVVKSWDSTAGFHGPLDESDDKQLLAEAQRKSLVLPCHVLLASNEFVYIY